MNLFGSITSFSSHSSLKYFYFCFCLYCFVPVSIVPAISLLLLYLLLDIWAWNKDTVLLSSIQWSEEVKSLSRVRLFATPWTVACQAPLSMGFSRQEYWSGLPFPSPGDLPDLGIEPGSPALEADALTSEPLGKPSNLIQQQQKVNIASMDTVFETEINVTTLLKILHYFPIILE